MIIVTKVEYVRVNSPSKCWTIQHLKQSPRDFFEINSEEDPVTAEALLEHVKGTEYVNACGERVVIGNKADPADVLGIQFEVFSNQRVEMETLRNKTSTQRKDIIRLKEQNRKLRSGLQDLRKASILTRVKWVFKGVNHEYLCNKRL